MCSPAVCERCKSHVDRVRRARGPGARQCPGGPSLHLRPMKAVVVGGVAGGMSFAARARRLAEDAQIVVLERDPYVSYANCGLPYYLAGEIGDRDALLLHTPQSLARSLALDVRTGHEVLAVSPARAVSGCGTARPAASTTRPTTRWCCPPARLP